MSVNQDHRAGRRRSRDRSFLSRSRSRRRGDPLTAPLTADTPEGTGCPRFSDVTFKIFKIVSKNQWNSEKRLAACGHEKNRSIEN